MIKKTVSVSSEYDILIDSGLLNDAGKILAERVKPCKVAVITDDIVDELYSQKVVKSLKSEGFEVVKFVFPNGESNKNLNTYTDILNFLAVNELTRSDIAIALGGGVVGDLTGFAAATYLRGIAFAQIPTTLLAAVDSSVGGKTGADLPAGKNLVGAFHQPVAVICDTDTLNTLPDAVFADGVAEAVKSGIIGDAELFELLESGNARGKSKEIIAASVALKSSIVEADEKESGQRRLLNLGHTFGHAVELLSGYGITHGSAVAKGMVIAAKIAENKGFATEPCATRIKNALQKNGLSTAMPFSAQNLATAAMTDKKRSGNHINLILPRRIGACEQYKVSVDKLEALIELGISE